MEQKTSSKWPSRPFQLLYSCYIFSCIGDRLWTFAIIFLLVELGGMRLVSANQLIEGISAMLLSTYVGNWLDRRNRKFGALTVLAVNNVCVACSAALLAICLSYSRGHYSKPLVQDEKNNNDFGYGICLTFSIVFCAISKCASEGQKMTFTKDWIVVMANREGAESLSARNAMLTTIDQLSSVVAPLIVGYILMFGGHRVACFVFIIWNLVSWVVERYILIKVYSQVKELSLREHCIKETDSNRSLKEDIQVLLGHSTDSKNGGQPGSWAPGKAIISFWRRMVRTLTAYKRQKTFPAAFGLALLYMTVLGFDGLAISFGKSQRLADDVLGVFRSLGSVLGICGAVLYAWIERKIGVKQTGLFGLGLQQLFLYFCVASIWLNGSPFDPFGYAKNWTFDGWLQSSISAFSGTPDYRLTASGVPAATIIESSVNGSILNLNTLFNDNEINWTNWQERGGMSILIFFFGLSFARLGLWMADLSITQIMQESIAEEERNTVFGAQNAFCQLFSVLKDILVILFPDPRTFGFLILMSVFFVGVGFISYCYYLVKSKKQAKKKSKKEDATRPYSENNSAKDLVLLKSVDSEIKAPLLFKSTTIQNPKIILESNST